MDSSVKIIEIASIVLSSSAMVGVIALSTWFKKRPVPPVSTKVPEIIIHKPGVDHKQEELNEKFEKSIEKQKKFNKLVVDEFVHEFERSNFAIELAKFYKDLITTTLSGGSTNSLDIDGRERELASFHIPKLNLQEFNDYV